MTFATLRISLFVFLGVLLTPMGSVSAQDTPTSDPATAAQPLSVGVYVHPPFVMKADGGFQGMAIDLWQWLATQLELESEYVEFSNVGELVNATASGEVDVALTNMTVTNGPVPDTPENRAKYGAPLSRAGKMTAARGN